MGEHLYARCLTGGNPRSFHPDRRLSADGQRCALPNRLGSQQLLRLLTSGFSLSPLLHAADGAISTLPIDPLRCARCLGEEKRRFRWLSKLAPGLMTHYWRQEGRNVNYFTQRRDDLTQLLAATDLAIAPSRFLRDFYIPAGMTAAYGIFAPGLKFGHLPPHSDQDACRTCASAISVNWRPSKACMC